MHEFVALYMALDATTRTHAKLRALAAYFAAAPPLDAAWAAYFLTGHTLKRVIRRADLKRAAIEASATPEWLFDACHETVGDFAETVALLLPGATSRSEASLAHWIEAQIAPLAHAAPGEVEARLRQCWSELDRDGRLVFGKLLTGAFRVGVGRELVHRALAQLAGVAAGDVAQALAGDWRPSASFWQRVRGEEAADAQARMHRPYPFCLAHALDADLAQLGAPEQWQVEWKWDGVRAQLVARGHALSIWSRGEELVSEQFPEIIAAARALPSGTVIDGELVAWPATELHPKPFAALQRRLGRKDPNTSLQRELPVKLLAYDLLEDEAQDIRAMPLVARRERLEGLLRATPGIAGVIVISPPLPNASWEEVRALRARAREHAAEGLMLKRRDSAYGSGRTRGVWWKWKTEPFTVDAVLMYAQPGSGRRASLYTDYTFGVWHEGALVAFAKAYSGLSDDELIAADRWIRAHTLEKFGPVRSVAPELVFELAFEGIQLSKRHKSGIAVRFPRIVRWRRDKPASEADTLHSVRALATVTP
ncbi:MAG TPA: ATP-dependent DNA ligase [Casimicrobiaceae bacterium]|nr:ATP-dependent DNA ligase [Casimicrobiaceae bacterium]